MLVFLIVILLLAALLEYLSLRGGLSCVDADFVLAKKRTEPDEAVELTVRIGNTGRLPISYGAYSLAFPLSASLPDGVDRRNERDHIAVRDVFRLWGRRSVARSLRFSLAKRGVYTVAGKELARGDFLGVQLMTDRFDTRRTILVYPRRLESSALNQALGSYSGLLSAERWLIRDPVLTLSVREYTGREPMREISWSQTARRGALTVREFDCTRSLDCRVLLSVHGLTGADDELLDRCCGAVRTICETLLEAGVEAQLHTNASLSGYARRPYSSVTAAQGQEDDLLEVLARVDPAACSGACELAEACLDSLTGAAACVLVVPHDDAEARAALALLNERSGMGALLVAVDALEET